MNPKPTLPPIRKSPILIKNKLSKKLDYIPENNNPGPGKYQSNTN